MTILLIILLVLLLGGGGYYGVRAGYNNTGLGLGGVLILLLIVWLLFGGSAHAAETVAVPSDRIAVLPIYQLAEPYLIAAFGAIFSALLAWALMQLQTRTGIKVSADARERIQTAATNAAGRILAAQEGNVATMSIPVGSPLVAQQVPKIQAAVGDAIKHLGVTPDDLGNLIAGKIGILQTAGAPPLPAMTTIAPNNQKVV